MIFSFNMTGGKALVSVLNSLADNMVEAASVAFYEALEVLMNAAQRITPFDTGTLRRSAYISKPSMRGGSFILEFGYGARHAPYVHERTDLNFKVGESKWLEKTAFAMGGTLMREANEKIIKYYKAGRRWSRGKYPERGNE